MSSGARRLRLLGERSKGERKMTTKQKITTFLWYDGNAEQAVEHYLSIFPGSKVTQVSRWGKGGPAPEGSIMTIAFELAGQGFVALNGGPMYKFTPAVS